LIRQITYDDIPTLIEIGRKAHEESEYNVMSFNPDKCMRLCEQIINSPAMLGIVTLKDDVIAGVIVAAVYPGYFTDELTASDLLVYVLPGYRGTRAFYRLCIFYITWARLQGAKLIFLRNSTGIEPEKVGKLYERMGFAQVGGIFRKEA
jgi:GNAT superfamily N-acetyltransferase